MNREDVGTVLEIAGSLRKGKSKEELCQSDAMVKAWKVYKNEC